MTTRSMSSMATSYRETGCPSGFAESTAVERSPIRRGGVVGHVSDASDAFDRLIGTSPALSQVVQRARRLTRVDTPVLLQGETGVGKDVFARALHNSGLHPDGPFVAVNCGGLSRDLLASELFGYVDGAFTGARRVGMVGKIEAARGGTLFLDEIAEMPLDLQPYLLRVLEGGEVYRLGSNTPRTVRFRLVTACNSDLRAAVNAGHFRMDLYYRISVTSLHIPALRERSGDLPALIEHFCREAAERHRTRVRPFAPEVHAMFTSYEWPGNVRELRNVVEAMTLLADGEVVGLTELPADLAVSNGLRPPLPTDGTFEGLARAERDAIQTAIHMHHGNLSQVAKELRISKSTLYIKMKRYALEGVLTDVRRAQR